MYKLFSFLLVSVALTLTACAKNPVSGQQDFVMLSESDEIQLGKQAHQDILKQYGVYPDKKLQAYVNRIGQELAKKSHRGHLNFTFTVLDSPQVNAFALPGGYIYITRGIMAYLNSEAELAAVIGHEIGHVTARHGVRQYSAAVATQFGLTLGALFVPELRSQDAQNVLNVLGTALLRGYGRDHELQADALGAEYLARTGYQTEAMIDVVRVLKNQETFARQKAKDSGKEPVTYHGVFATHPDNDTRLQAVVRQAKPLQRKDAKLNKNVFLRNMDEVDFGDSEAQGIVRDNNFYHKDLNLALSFPKTWRIQNQPTALVAIEPNQQAFMQIWTKDAVNTSQTKQLQDFFNVNSLQQTRTSKVSGYAATTAVVNLKTPFGQGDAYVGIITKGKQAYYFFLTAKQNLGNYQSEFDATFNSLHTLSNQEQKLARALKLKIIQAGANTQYATLAKQAAFDEYAEQQLRLLNGHYPSGKIEQGQLLKTVK